MYTIIGLIVAGFAALFGGCLGVMLVELYKIRLQSYNDFVKAFANCTDWAPIIGGKSSIERNTRMMEYSKQETIIRLHGSHNITDFINQVRKEANLEFDRPLWLDYSVFPEWKNKVDRSNYFSTSNYNRLCEIVKRDLRSLEFKIGIL